MGSFDSRGVSSMYDSMNSSVERANRFHDDRARANARNEDLMRDSAMADALQGRSLRDRQFDLTNRQFGEQGRQFDSRMNILRDLFSRPQPQFFGGDMGQGQPMQQGGGFAAGIGGPVNRPQPAQQNMGGIQPALENYLLRYLRG